MMYYNTPFLTQKNQSHFRGLKNIRDFRAFDETKIEESYLFNFFD